MNRRNISKKLLQQAVGAVGSIGSVGLIALFVMLTLSSHGQAPAAAPVLNAGPTYTTSDGNGGPRFPNVDVVFTLAGADGNPIMPKPGDLKLFSLGTDIGVAGSIRQFGTTGYGITAILALDASGSMRGAPINAIHSSIARFVNQARTQDKVAVLTIADGTHTDVPFGAPQSALTQELETVQPRGHFTRLYDGLMVALGQLANIQPKRRQLLVISDGHDEGSQLVAKEGSNKALGEVIFKAKSAGVVIDCIGLTKDLGQYLDSLQRLARETGGTYRRALTAQDIDNDIRLGIDATRATPVASFETSHLAGDGTLHPAQLRWVPGNLSSPAFILAPKINLFRNPWVWGLGACFLAGIVLLAISWFGSRRKPVVAAQAPAASPRTSPASAPVPAFETRPSSPGMGDSGGPGRTPTMPETGPTTVFYPGSGPSAAHNIPPSPPPPAQPLRANVANVAKEPPKERSKTQLAVFFEAPDQGPYAQIAVQSGDLASQTIPVTTKLFNIGALAGNHLILPGDATISGQHARLLWENSILKVEDMNSTNGTFLNETQLAPGRHLLKPGDQIRLGKTVFLVTRA